MDTGQDVTYRSIDRWAKKQTNKQTGIALSLVSKGKYSISDAVPVFVAFNVSIALMLTLMLVQILICWYVDDNIIILIGVDFVAMLISILMLSRLIILMFIIIIAKLGTVLLSSSPHILCLRSSVALPNFSSFPTCSNIFSSFSSNYISKYFHRYTKKLRFSSEYHFQRLQIYFKMKQIYLIYLLILSFFSSSSSSILVFYLRKETGLPQSHWLPRMLCWK